MNEDAWNKKMLEYEGLVISTTRYWRHKISEEMSDDDIKQELRIKIYKALLTFDPNRGYPEHKHVFGAVRNMVKDLIKKKNQLANQTLVSELVTRDGRTIFGIVLDEDKTELLQNLSRMDQEISVMIIQGFTLREVAETIGVELNYVKHRISVIRNEIARMLDA